MVEYTVKNEGSSRNFEKLCMFYDVHFSLCEKHIFVKPCLKQHACLVDPLRDLFGFSNAHTLMFFDRQEGELKQRKGLEIWLPRRNFDLPDLPKGPIPTVKEAQRGAQG